MKDTSGAEREGGKARGGVHYCSSLVIFFFSRSVLYAVDGIRTIMPLVMVEYDNLLYERTRIKERGQSSSGSNHQRFQSSLDIKM